MATTNAPAIKLGLSRQPSFHRRPASLRTLPGERHLTRGVPVKKREGLEHDRDRGMESGAHAEQLLPALTSSRVKRIARQRQRNPRAGVDEDELSGRAVPEDQ